LLRPHRHRRRAGRPGRRGVRGVRGAAHRAGGAHRHRRAGGPELADRELPRLPGRGVRIAADRAGPAAGHQVRGRAAHHARRGQPRRQRLGAPGLDDMTGRGVYYGSTLTEAAACTGQDIYIVGGANSAGQAAVYLAKHAKSVTILVRGASLERSMSYYLIQQLREIGNISVRTCTEVIAAEGSDHLERLTLRDTSTGATEIVDAQWLFLFIGAAPLTDWLDGVVDRDERGFVVAGPDLSASIDGDRPPGWDLDRAPYHL